jgi:hypothetical protein
MESSGIPIWVTFKNALRAITEHPGRLATLSLVFLLLYTALAFLQVELMVWLEVPVSQLGVILRKIVFSQVVIWAFPATILVTQFLRSVAEPAAPRGLRAATPFYVAVFWRCLLLALVISAGGLWLDAISYYDPDRPEWPGAWEIAAGYILAIGSALLALRLSPALAAAAIGQPAGLTEAWRSLRGQFLRFLVVFFGVLIPLYALSYFIGSIIFVISMMIEEHLIIAMVPANPQG